MLSRLLPNLNSNPSYLRPIAFPTYSFEFPQSLQRCFVNGFSPDPHTMLDPVVVNKLHDTIPFWHNTLKRGIRGRGGIPSLAPFVPRFQQMIHRCALSTCLASVSFVVFIWPREFDPCLVHDAHEFLDFFLGSWDCQTTLLPSSATSASLAICASWKALQLRKLKSRTDSAGEHDPARKGHSVVCVEVAEALLRGGRTRRESR